MVEKCLSGRRLLSCGVQSGFREENEQGLSIRAGETSAVFVSRTYDSGQSRMEWGRALLQISHDVVPQVYVWLFEDRQEGEEVDRLGDAREQFRRVKECAQYYSDYREMALYGAEHGRGRFAKLAVEIFPEEGCGYLTGYSLSFPKESFTRYLPELYRNNVQLERFLAVQESIYLELEEEIDRLEEELDYESCSRKQAERLLTWMGWGDLARRLPDETVRELLRTGISLTSRKGTCEYYVKLTEILTGKRAVMIEEPERGKAVVLVLEKPEDKREVHLDWLRQNVPLFARIDFVILDRTQRLDGRFFLDRNAFLSERETELSVGGVCIDRLVLL